MLETVERRVEQYIASLDEPIINGLYKKLPSGKRLRAKLILYIAGEGHDAVKLASVVELIHAASLLHDDVLDDTLLRRNQLSINALFGNKVAIMFGDILYSKGFFELSSLGQKITGIISNAVTKLSIGELLDVELSKNFNTSKERYIDMIYGKTASLIEASAMAAANLAGKNEKNYGVYGKNLGLAFQIIDDLLDITQSSHTLGKPSMHDFEEGKATLPYIYLYEALDDIEKAKLLAMHKKKLSSNEVAWIGSKMNQYKIIQKCYIEAKALIDDAVALISDEPKLVLIANEMIERSF